MVPRDLNIGFHGWLFWFRAKSTTLLKKQSGGFKKRAPAYLFTQGMILPS